MLYVHFKSDELNCILFCVSLYVAIGYIMYIMYACHYLDLCVIDFTTEVSEK